MEKRRSNQLTILQWAESAGIFDRDIPFKRPSDAESEGSNTPTNSAAHVADPAGGVCDGKTDDNIMPMRIETAHLDDKKLQAALKTGDSKALIASLEEGNKARVSAINCQFTKDLARAVLAAVDYEVPEVVKTAMNKTVAGLQELSKIFKDQGITDKKVFDALAKKIEASSNEVTLSDGVARGFQAMLIECLSYRLRSDPEWKNVKMADALDGAINDIIRLGPKRNETAEEKKARKESGLADEDEEEEAKV